MNSVDYPVSITRATQLIDAGGPVVVALIIMSIIGLAVLLLKIWQFFMLQIDKRKFVEQAITAWKTNDIQRMHEILAATTNPIARVLEAAVQVCSNQTIDVQLAREEVLRVATLQLAKLRSYLRILEVIAALSPLLGLFGTVLGMIEAFRRLENAGTAVDPSILSGGIWEALLTTAAGLAVAIPAIIALNWLEHRIENIKLAMEDSMTRMFTHKQLT